jgi:hypothetical protein
MLRQRNGRLHKKIVSKFFNFEKPDFESHEIFYEAFCYNATCTAKPWNGIHGAHVAGFVG